MNKLAKQKFSKQGEPLNEFGLTEAQMQTSVDAVQAVKTYIKTRTGFDLQVIILDEEILGTQSLVKGTK